MTPRFLLFALFKENAISLIKGLSMPLRLKSKKLKERLMTVYIMIIAKNEY